VTTHRLTAGVGVALFLGLLHGVAPDAARREAWAYLIALPLGYGHLIGGVLASRARYRALVPDGVSPRACAAFVALGVLGLLAAYTRALQSPLLRPWVLAPMLVVSAWHIAENDLALSRAYRRGLALGPVGRGRRDVCLVAVFTAALAWAALATPSGGQWSSLVLGQSLSPLRWIGMADLVAGVLLYHAFSWLRFSEDRARRLGSWPAARLRRLLLLSHALPLVANAILYFWLDALHAYVASPALYLFWSVLHAFQTAAVRGVERPAQ
jgi:uncharacterized protein YjeT (DUF2065 family)